jgi:hypothetical protein
VCVVEVEQSFIERRIINEQLNGQSALASSFSCFDSPSYDKILITHALILFQTRFLYSRAELSVFLMDMSLMECRPMWNWNHEIEVSLRD